MIKCRSYTYKLIYGSSSILLAGLPVAVQILMLFRADDLAQEPQWKLDVGNPRRGYSGRIASSSEQLYKRERGAIECLVASAKPYSVANSACLDTAGRIRHQGRNRPASQVWRFGQLQRTIDILVHFLGPFRPGRSDTMSGGIKWRLKNPDFAFRVETGGRITSTARPNAKTRRTTHCISCLTRT
jgi:hypothetical protein